MKSVNTKKANLEVALRHRSLISIITDKQSGNEKYRGFVIGLSELFLATDDILEWHSDGLRLYPRNKISKCIRSQREENNEKVLKSNGVQATLKYGWLILNSFESLFYSIQERNETLVIAYDNITAVGEISKILSDTIVLRSFDPDGVWYDEPCEILFSEITHLCIGDEYSTVLSAYADAQ